VWTFTPDKPRQHRNEILKYASKAAKQEQAEDTNTVNAEIVLKP